jgi:phospholipid-binding lipoprotein MlaA
MEQRKMATTILHRVVSRSNSLREVLKLKVFLSAILFLSLLLINLLPPNTALAEEAKDPYIAVNRNVHGFNRTVDTAFFKPLAITYQTITPRIVKKGIRNFFSNLDDVQVIINDLLQLKLGQAGSDFGRLIVNSTAGFGGIFNVAGGVLGIEKHAEDFGQTLAHWGVANGPYMVLPLLGPSTLRESAGIFTDFILNPIKLEDAGAQDKARLVAAVDARASFLLFDDLVIGDDYLFLRGIYLQNLEYKTNGQQSEVSLANF